MTNGKEKDGSDNLDIYMQRFGADGTPIGDRLGIEKPGDQNLSNIDTLADGRVILTFSNETGDATDVTTLNFRIIDPRDPDILGTNSDDTIVGREDASTISGFDGDDKLTGRAGGDLLQGQRRC